MTLDADFPGGNIVVEALEGDTARLRQDRRTTTEWWFYWSFRARGVAGRTAHFRFTDGDVFGALGPCVSPGGASWRWLGRDAVRNNAFSCAFPEAWDAAYFSFCLPYTEAHLRAFLRDHPAARPSVLAESERGRPVELLTLESARGTYVVPLTARLHACETMGSYVLEGVLDFWSGGGDESRFLREHVDLRAVPFFDKDGVEEGDQGKLRAPHDHNRDFTDAPLYAATRALIAQIPGWRGKMVLALDLHCPWVRGGRNEEIFLVGAPQPWQAEQDRFAALLEQSQQGALVYRSANNLPFGQEWNRGDPPTSSHYFRANHPVAFAAAVEFPYALAGGRPVTADGARAFGRDLGRAISLYLQAR